MNASAMLGLYLGVLSTLLLFPELRQKTCEIMGAWLRLFVETPLRLVTGRRRGSAAQIARLEREIGKDDGSHSGSIS